MFGNKNEVKMMIEKLEDYQFPLRGEAAASYLDLMIRQRTGKKTQGHVLFADDFKLDPPADVEALIDKLQRPLGVADCTK